MRRAAGASVLDAACFPLVPFPNRIGHGRFAWLGETITLQPNFPGHDHPHPLHGFGWISEWQVTAQDAASATLEHSHAGGEWPWPYVARQTFRLSPDGLEMALSLTNRSDRPMPAGLGFHPYFPRTDETLLHALHRGEWQTGADCLPIQLNEAHAPQDWWQGKPVATRPVDTVYTGREGDIVIVWPERCLSLTMKCDPLLGLTSIFVPHGEDWFCAEPVSHMTNAANHAAIGNGLFALPAGEILQAKVMLSARHTSS